MKPLPHRYEVRIAGGADDYAQLSSAGVHRDRSPPRAWWRPRAWTRPRAERMTTMASTIDERPAVYHDREHVHA